MSDESISLDEMDRHYSARARAEMDEQICPMCEGKGFVKPDGTPDDAFEGPDAGRVIPCPLCVVRGVKP